MFSNIIVLVAITFSFIKIVLGHGMMIDPVNRASLWRFDPSAPPDYTDNQGYCGGKTIQWDVNDGKCGLCGDDYRVPVPRPHENGGYYGEGKIVATYKHSSLIDVSIILTANHHGSFKYALCALSHPKDLETEDCFEQVLLADGSDNYKVSTSEPGTFNMTLKLPEGVTCEQCVLRWDYTTGNSWGDCGNGTEAVGCGPQETFHSCSDISIQ